MTNGNGGFRLTGEPARCGKRAANQRAPNLSLTDWQRLLDACPIKRTGNITTGDFLACAHVSQTQLSVARITGGCTFGTRRFIYLPQHDLLVRVDFHLWAMSNWRTVLCGADAACGKAKAFENGEQ